MREWRTVPDTDGGYEVSNDGQVRSLDRTVKSTCRGTEYSVVRKGRLLKPDLLIRNTKHGVKQYRRVGIAGRRIFVAALMLETFVGPRPPGQVARHLDDDSLNDRIENLAWGTHAENSADCRRNGHNYFANKTHCPAGHEYTAENTRIIRRHEGGKVRETRECFTCLRERDRARHARKVANRPPKPLPPHGTRMRYEKHGCKCEECNAFNAARARAYRLKLKTK